MVPVNIMESENNLIVENAIGGKKIIICFGIRIAGRAFFAEINSVDPNIVPMLIVRGMSQDICVEWWEVMLIKARCEYLENQGQIVQDPLKRLNEQLNENDNPVIILNYLKKIGFGIPGTDLSSRKIGRKVRPGIPILDTIQFEVQIIIMHFVVSRSRMASILQ